MWGGIIGRCEVEGWRKLTANPRREADREVSGYGQTAPWTDERQKAFAQRRQMSQNVMKQRSDRCNTEPGALWDVRISL